MPTSPEAASVVERLRVQADSYEANSYDFLALRVPDLRALLAVVEAAKLAWDHGTNENLDDLGAKLNALYTPDSAEERE